MADTKVQDRSSETGRSVARRPEYTPSRNILSLSPFEMMRRLSDEMDRAFSSSFGLSRDFSRSGIWSPALEVCERDGNLIIDAELPGMQKDDVKVEATDEGLVIEGERRQDHEHKEGGFHRSERSYGHFYRLIPLPQDAQTDKTKAEFKNGVLHIEVPVPENKSSQRRKIPIEGK